MSNLVTNRKARHDYHVEQKLEAGVVLLGSEVKSLRAGNANLKEAWVRVDARGVWLVGCHISPFAQARDGHEPTRERRLLLHASQIDRLRREVQAKGKTLVPLRIYTTRRRIKVEIATATGKKNFDKRRAIKDRDMKRDMARGE